MEIETICRYRLPIVTVVLNNGGIYRGDKPGEFPPSPTGLAPNAGYDMLIEAFGGVGYNAEDKGSLTKALTDALPAGRPALINCVIDPAASRRQAWRVSALPDRPRSERPLRQADRSVRRRRLPVCFPGALFYLSASASERVCRSSRLTWSAALGPPSPRSWRELRPWRHAALEPSVFSSPNIAG